MRTELAFVAGAGAMGILSGYGVAAYAEWTADARLASVAGQGVGAAGTMLLAGVTGVIAARMFWRAYTLRNPKARLPWQPKKTES